MHSSSASVNINVKYRCIFALWELITFWCLFWLVDLTLDDVAQSSLLGTCSTTVLFIVVHGGKQLNIVYNILACQKFWMFFLSQLHVLQLTWNFCIWWGEKTKQTDQIDVGCYYTSIWKTVYLWKRFLYLFLFVVHMSFSCTVLYFQSYSTC